TLMDRVGPVEVGEVGLVGDLPHASTNSTSAMAAHARPRRATSPDRSSCPGETPAGRHSDISPFVRFLQLRRFPGMRITHFGHSAALALALALVGVACDHTPTDPGHGSPAIAR